MRSLWEGGGDGRGVTLFGWKEDKREEGEEEEDEEGGTGRGQQRRGAVRSIIPNSIHSVSGVLQKYGSQL